MDTSVLNTLAMIAPDLMEEMELRALVLERVGALGPIGRRALATRLHLAEREVRGSADALKEAGLLVQSASGMELTERGQSFVEAARVVSRGRRSLSATEISLARRLNVDRVRVVHGDADRDNGVLTEIGRAAAHEIRFLLQGTHVMAVSGGRTVAQAAQALCPAAPMDVTVVPASGGMRGGVRTQANTLAEDFGAKLGGNYRMLHLPDGLSAQAAEELSALPQVREALELLAHADVLLYGAGVAQELAQQRGVSLLQRELLAQRGAVGEALGFYFDINGQVVGGSSPAISAARLGRSNRAALLAGGSSKAKAILGICRHHPHRLLVTDEGAANGILDLLRV